jgi:hypothetical protein
MAGTLERRCIEAENRLYDLQKRTPVSSKEIDDAVKRVIRARKIFFGKIGIANPMIDVQKPLCCGI